MKKTKKTKIEAFKQLENQYVKLSDIYYYVGSVSEIDRDFILSLIQGLKIDIKRLIDDIIESL